MKTKVSLWDHVLSGRDYVHVSGGWGVIQSRGEKDEE